MKVSRNELLQLCQKAFQGLGFPAGSDRDAALMVSWLDAHQLPGTHLLQQELPLLLATSPRPATLTTHSTSQITIDGHGQSALLIAPNAIEMANAKIYTTDTDKITIVLTACHSPLFAIALPTLRGTICSCLHIHWQHERQRYDFVVDSEKRAFFYGDVDTLLSDMSCDISITCIRDSDIDLFAYLRREHGSPMIDASEFARREQASLVHGINVDDTIWHEVGKLSRRILIAATPESHAHGAGAGGSDND